MAASFPTKANWVAGDVLTASALDDLAGTINLLSNASATTGSQLISNAAGTSFAYSPTPSASNPVLNSAFQVWQRGTSISLAASTSTTYTADRWCTATGANQAITISRQATGDTTNLPNIQYCLRYQRNSGQTGTAQFGLAQNIETLNSVPYAGKTVIISFYARAGANYSSASNALNLAIYSGTGTDQNVYSGYTGSATPVTGTATLTTTWQRFTFTGTIPTTTTELAPFFYWTPVGTAGANDYFEVTGVQIDVGSVALPFRTNGGTFQGELAACQRYFYNDSLNSAGGLCRQASTTQSYTNYRIPTVMRASPSVTITNQTGGSVYYLATSTPTLTVGVNGFYPAQYGLVITHAAIGAGGNCVDLNFGTITIFLNAEL